MWAKQCHKPPMTGNGKRSTCKNGDDWGMVQTALFSPHYMGFNGIQWDSMGFNGIQWDSMGFNGI